MIQKACFPFHKFFILDNYYCKYHYCYFVLKNVLLKTDSDFAKYIRYTGNTKSIFQI
jgi:hypothetical protein